MSRAAIKRWVEIATLHPHVLAENFSEGIGALDFSPLAIMFAHGTHVELDRPNDLPSGGRALLKKKGQDRSPTAERSALARLTAHGRSGIEDNVVSAGELADRQRGRRRVQ